MESTAAPSPSAGSAAIRRTVAGARNCRRRPAASTTSTRSANRRRGRASSASGRPAARAVSLADVARTIGAGEPDRRS
jgi:hypothetical protein